MRVSLIAAMAENRTIGAGNRLPWHLPEDLKRFRRLTTGHPVIMGRKTYDSIGKPLDGRDNIVVTRNADFHAAGVACASSIEEALQIAKACAARRGANEITVIGGAEIFAAMLPTADRIYLTRIHARPEGDTTFPELDPAAWREVSAASVSSDPRDTALATLHTYERAA